MDVDVNGVIRIPSSLDKDFFLKWLMFLKPIHNMTLTDMKVLSVLLKKRYELSKSVGEKDNVDELLKERKIMKSVMDECGLEPQNFAVYLTRLRRCGAYENDVINKKLIPNIKDNNKFVALMYFDLK